MSESRTTSARPRSVTVAAVITAISGAVDVAVGIALLASRTESSGPSAEAVVTGAVCLIAGGLVVGLCTGYLLRGHNSARLVVTLMTVARLVLAAVVAVEFDRGSILGAAAMLVLAFVTLWLLWRANSTGFFESHRESRLTESMTETLPARRGRRLASWVSDFVIELAALGLTIAATPDISVDSAWSLVLATILLSVVGWILRPVLVATAGRFGWVGAGLLALFSNAAIIGAALWLTPGIVIGDAFSAVVASWIYALVMTLITWAFSTRSFDYLVVHAVRLNGRSRPVEDPDVPGVIFVQLDGMPAPVLEYEMRAGNLPTLSRWLRSGTHELTEWVARIPSTTPVSQAGILHGANEGIPAFRWYEKELGRLLVANRPGDAAIVEARLTNGRGLLADDGVSISNLFSGDAGQSLLTMSGLRQHGRGLGQTRSYAAFFTHPAGFFRAVILSIGEIGKEFFQARRQKARDVQPRTERSGTYVLLRAVTNVLLRDLNLALVVEAMMNGSRSVYVDFVDYDEIAHHAGVTRPESLAALYGLDEVLHTLELLAASGSTPRPYKVVALSDHGQSQGATFAQRYGQSLEALVVSLTSADSAQVATHADAEAWGPVNIFLRQLAGKHEKTKQMIDRASAKRESGTEAGDTVDQPRSEVEGRPEVVVINSGNLGGIWFAKRPGHLILGEIEDAYPGLVDTLATHPGIGFVVVMTAAGPVAIGATGAMDLTTGSVEGTDPLAGFGPDARADFKRVAEFDNAPDIYVNSLYDAALGEVAAFEELVGCHGGMGGWQTRPILVHPSEFELDPALLDADGRLVGAELVHQQLVRWLEGLGHRKGLAAPIEHAAVPAVD